VTAGRLIHAYTDVSRYPHRLTVQCVFLCEDAGDDITLAPDEHEEYRWLPLDEMEKLDAIAFLADLLRVRPFD
jgi:8-oxo-dGTP pyrophosphatase MutT (NUDIX family)